MADARQLSESRARNKAGPLVATRVCAMAWLANLAGTRRLAAPAKRRRSTLPRRAGSFNFARQRDPPSTLNLSRRTHHERHTGSIPAFGEIQLLGRGTQSRRG